MAEIKLEKIGHKYGASPTWALEPLTLKWEHALAYALLGPSGCGKTTMLDIMSGLIKPSTGKVLLNGQDVTDRPLHERNIAQVFQFPVVYRTMTVRENLAFPLKCRGVSLKETKHRVSEIAELLGLTGILNKSAKNLPADFKQIVSLGRGLIRKDVAALLLDEPLTVIDPQSKWNIRQHLKEAQAKFDTTMVFVTHDQNEAMTFADQVVVMNQGKIIQIGTPVELFERPLTKFVGYFIGSPSMNFIPCMKSNQGITLNGRAIKLSASVPDNITENLELGIRPEYIRMAKNGDVNVFESTVKKRKRVGRFLLLSVDLLGHEIKVKLKENTTVSEKILLTLPPNRCHLYSHGQLLSN